MGFFKLAAEAAKRIGETTQESSDISTSILEGIRKYGIPAVMASCCGLPLFVGLIGACLFHIYHARNNNANNQNDGFPHPR